VKAAAAALAALLASPAFAGTCGSPEVEVSAKSGAYELQGSFEVDAPSGVVWSVLTDYDHLSDFVDSMRSSRVLAADGARKTVQQDAEARAMWFRRSLRVTLDVEEAPFASIKFTDTAHGDFRAYSGSWTILPAAGATRVEYRLHAVRGFFVPPLLGKKIFKSNAQSLLEQVQDEIERRGQARSGLPPSRS
jgi:carbon monoxide dehydrogenase subunit G